MSFKKRLFRFFFFNDTATTEIYTLSLHDALPICVIRKRIDDDDLCSGQAHTAFVLEVDVGMIKRSEEHTSELQSRLHLVCRLLLEKKKQFSEVLDVRLGVSDCSGPRCWVGCHSSC